MNLNDLDLNPESIDDVDPDNVPLFGGGVAPPPQPGTFTFRLPPAQEIMNSFESVETADQGQRIQARLREGAALWNESLNMPYETSISNRVRYITIKKGTPDEERIGISDMAQVLRACGVTVPKEERTNAGYGHALVKAGGSRFVADHTLTANCSPTRDIYKDGSVIKDKKGCGTRYAVEAYTSGGRKTHAIPTEEGKVMTRFPCMKCGAELRSWGQLRNFRKARVEPKA